MYTPRCLEINIHFWGWNGWMASLTRWTWVLVNSGSSWWTGRPGVLQFMGSQRVGVGHDWATDLIWSERHINVRFNQRSRRSQREELRPWQRSWGRRLGIHKGGIEPQESPWKFSSIYPKTRVCLLSALCSHLHLWLYGGLSPTTSLWKKS